LTGANELTTTTHSWSYLSQV